MLPYGNIALITYLVQRANLSQPVHFSNNTRNAAYFNNRCWKNYTCLHLLFKIHVFFISKTFISSQVELTFDLKKNT